MVNKKGWIRIMEAFIGIILIAGFLVVLYSNIISPSNKSEELYRFQKIILDEIAENNDLRENVLNNIKDPISDFVDERIPSGFNYTIKICEPGDICSMNEYHEETYSSERIISSTLKKYDPKKIKIFMWEI